MGRYAAIIEQVRSEVEEQGAAGCFKNAVHRFHNLTGIGTDGLWACVEAFLRGDDPSIYVRRIMKAHGGTPEIWMKWVGIISKEPGCPRHANRV